MIERNDILCVCALKLGETISGQTLGALDGIDLLVSTLPKCDNDREESINMNRATAQHYATKNSVCYKAVMLIDGDVVATKESVDELIKNYDENGCVSVRTKEKDNGHIYCSFCLLPFEKYVELSYWNKNTCQCSIIARSMNVHFVDGVSVREKRKRYAV